MLNQRRLGVDLAARALDARVAGSQPSLPLAGYAGTWRDRWFGDFRIEEKDGALRMRATTQVRAARRRQLRIEAEEQ